VAQRPTAQMSNCAEKTLLTTSGLSLATSFRLVNQGTSAAGHADAALSLNRASIVSGSSSLPSRSRVFPLALSGAPRRGNSSSQPASRSESLMHRATRASRSGNRSGVGDVGALGRSELKTRGVLYLSPKLAVLEKIGIFSLQPHVPR
jgi:hypothetical protein